MPRGHYGRNCEFTSEVYTTFKNYLEIVTYSIESMIQNNVRPPLDSIMESFAIATICPAACLSNDARSSILSSILNAINNSDLDELDIEHLNFIMSNLMSIIVFKD